ncbi:MAG TPA: ribonucleoside-diphosphate reductase, adenosylcobalamin-dependent, partial [Marinobacter adhaerens]|nr:ribonucleoside-diphosphate reductase, adenosylcobalamin-dependent [Marinobacter adhaerens]
SLLITEDFIEAVRNGDDWHLSFPVTQKEVEDEKLDLSDESQFVYRDFPEQKGYVVNGEGKVACRIYRTLKAQFIWDTIMTSTYDYAEPGFILIDKV